MSNPTRKAQICLLATLLLACAYVRHPVEYGSSTSRFFLLSAVVDYHAFHIDQFSGGTVDRSAYGGHHYSNKAIGGPLLAVPVYYLLRALPSTRGRQLISPFHRYAVCLMTTGLIFALLGVVMWRMAQRWGASPSTALWVVFGFSFGTIAWIHATMFTGHLMAGALCFFGFAMIQPLRSPPAEPPCPESGDSATDSPDEHAKPVAVRGLSLTSASALAVVAGVITGLGAICDYTAMYLAAVLTLYMWTGKCSIAHKAAFVLGGTIPLGLLLTYNSICFGSPLAMSYGCLSYAPFAQEAARGLMGVGLPDLSVLVRLLFSPSRGVFFIMPVLLFGVSGLYAMRRVRSLRAEMWVVVAAALGYLLINAGWVGWHGGWTFGPRYLVPMLPFLAMGMVFANLHSRAFYILFAVSVLQLLPAILGVPHTPEGIRNPLPELIIPLISRGYIALNWGQIFGLPGLRSWLPFLAGLPFAAWLTFRLARQPERKQDEMAPMRRGAKVACALAVLWIAIGMHAVRSKPRTVDYYQEVLLDHYHNFRLDACLRYVQESCPTVWQRRERK